MQIKIGQIYKVKPEFENVCDDFWDSGKFKKGKYVVFFEEKKYKILDKNKKEFDWCNCFKPEHLEPLEKTLYNLEVNNFVEDRDGEKRKILGVIESSSENPIYVISYQENHEHVVGLRSAKELENNGYKVVQPESTEEIKEMTVEEVSKLVGKKVKIVE